MLAIVREKRRVIRQRDCGNSHVGVRKGLTLRPLIAPQQTSLACNCRSHRQAFQTVDESFGLGLLTGPKPGIHFRDVNRTTGKEVALLDKMVQEFGAGIAPVQVIQNDEVSKRILAIRPSDG